MTAEKALAIGSLPDAWVGQSLYPMPVVETAASRAGSWVVSASDLVRRHRAAPGQMKRVTPMDERGRTVGLVGK